jgi:DNA-binding MarR family transcriptional regulator
LLKRLENEGLIIRIPKTRGHPYTEVKLTPKGLEACEPGIEILKDVIAETMSVLTQKEMGQLGELTRPLQLKSLEMLHMKLKSPPGRPDEVTMPYKVHKKIKNK